MSRVRFVQLGEWVEHDEDPPEALLGEATLQGNALPTGGDYCMYGKAGVGKTTLFVDTVAHLGSGRDWLGLTVARPVTIGLIENEGPRNMFRQKLRAKLDGWDGDDFSSRVHVLDEPWSRFSFADHGLRADLTAQVLEHGIELLVAGPLAELGVQGGGTPADVSAFYALLKAVRAGLPDDRRLAIALNHHENVRGAISGAWSRAFDTVVHATGVRFGLELHWEKVRHGSDIHGAKWSLAWDQNAGFALTSTEDDPGAGDREQLRSAIDWIWAHVTERPGQAKGTVEDAFANAHGRGGRALGRTALDLMLAESADPLAAVHPDGGSRRIETRSGESARGKYLHAASSLNPPIRRDENGGYGGIAENPVPEGIRRSAGGTESPPVEAADTGRGVSEQAAPDTNGEPSEASEQATDGPPPDALVASAAPPTATTAAPNSGGPRRRPRPPLDGQTDLFNDAAATTEPATEPAVDDWMAEHDAEDYREEKE